uniref:cilia- and flagella-associated protein 276 n=1 Tax=Pristiophorus japonicus TaxID=55135 RepID=UPI00398EA7A9
MPETRDPFPFPKYENDDTFRGRKKDMQSIKCQEPTHIAQLADPWNRLNAAATVASANKGIYLHNPKAPKDSLDIQLNAVYNHSKEFLKHKNEIMLQKSSCEPDSACWLNRSDKSQEETFRKKMAKDAVHKGICGCAPEKDDTGAHNLHQRASPRLWISPKKLSIHSMEGAITSQHTAATNGGYSRKFDGGFFTI